MDLYQKIQNKFDLEDGLATKLAKGCGYASGSALRKAVREKREFGNFYGLVKLVQELFPKEEKQLMSEYASIVDPNKKTARCLLEYCEVNGLKSTKKELVERMLNTDKKKANELSKEWAEIYNVDMVYVSGQKSLTEILEMYNNIRPSKPETKLALTIYKLYCFMDNNMYDLILQYVTDVSFLINEINEEYIRESFECRLNIFKISYLNRHNRLEESRLICKDMLGRLHNRNFRMWILMHMGNSYILESYDKAMEYFNKGLEISTKDDKRVVANLKRSINFVSTLWNKDSIHFDLESKCPSDVHEIAFYYIRFRQYIKATQTLDTVDFESLSDNSKGFHLYFRGLISGNKEDFTKSIVYFTKSNDVFYKVLPIRELKKLGVDSCILEALMAS